MVSCRITKTPAQPLGVKFTQLCHRVDSVFVQQSGASRPHTPQFINRHRIQELLHPVGWHHPQPIGFTAS